MYKIYIGFWNSHVSKVITFTFWVQNTFLEKLKQTTQNYSSNFYITYLSNKSRSQKIPNQQKLNSMSCKQKCFLRKWYFYIEIDFGLKIIILMFNKTRSQKDK